MAYVYLNNNPCQRSTSDCVIRAISTVLDVSWETVYTNLCAEGLDQCDLPNANHVFDKYLKGLGFQKHSIPNSCPSCYTLRQFCYDHPFGDYIVCTGDHVVAAIDGDYIDNWDSGSVIVSCYYER